MYCRIFNHETNRYYRSVVYGKINAGCFEECIVLNPQHSRFELVPYFSRADTSATPQIWTIQPETGGWVRLSGAQLLPFAQYLKKHDIAYRLDHLAGYPDVCSSHEFLAALITNRTVPLEESGIPLRQLADADAWHYLSTQEDADAFMQDFAGFHDATLDKLIYEEDTCMSRITATFDNSGWYGVVEICFEGILMMNLRPPQENYDRFIYDGILRVTEESVYWADESCKDASCSCIEALSAKWRKIG